MNTKPLIYDLSLQELIELMHTWEEPSYRARQIWQGLYQQYWESPNEFSNLSLNLREKLEQYFSFSHLACIREVKSVDGYTEKSLFRLNNKMAVEAVLMRYPPRRDNKSERHTLCISTQVGCAMGCVFCATGQMGFRKNLTSGEIIEQVLHYSRHLSAINKRVTNIVYMGMGEPFHNYEETLKSIGRLNHSLGFNFGSRRFTISTVGLVPFIRRLSNETLQVNLAISLHAADNELRSSMLPVNDKYPLEQLIPACHDYVNKTHRRITFEWALIEDINDSKEDAIKLIKLLDGMLCHVNIIPLNPTDGYSGSPTSGTRALVFQSELQRNNIACTIRMRRGIEIQAGCGQLATEEINRVK
jgi:23S rRNA (adenine2503-C2)-methyltransferase